MSVSSETKKESLGKALGRLSSGVYIVTSSSNGTDYGMLATWITQAAFDPPMLSLAVQKERDFLSALDLGSGFSVNVLTKQNTDIFKAFARPYKEGEDRFEGLALTNKNTSGPIFASALSYLDCVVKEKVNAGDHVLVLAEIISGELLNESHEPMLHTRKNGFQY